MLSIFKGVNPLLLLALFCTCDTVHTLCIKVVDIQVPPSLLRTIHMSCLLASMSRTPHACSPVVAYRAGQVLALFHTLL